MPNSSNGAIPRWLEWAREIQALAQTGLHYAPDDYHRDRYRRLIGIAAEIVAEHSTLETDGLVRVFHSARGYATPKVSVRGAVFRGGKILLVRERTDGGWCMPGGWADVGDSPSAMVEREVMEESGLRVRAARLVGVYDKNNEIGQREVMHLYDLVFLCDDLGGEPGSSNETSDARFFGLDEIPALSTARTSVRNIQEAFAHWKDPALQPVFD
ncbi:MAG: NUDIX hydrolase N-terminal domain-containing protein [Anaerolineales bacterium]|nr:NUDIX hydrolase N-terminal domain-containing protein [Anaerolineales bacterium]